LLFTLFVNGLTIKKLLLFLKLHLPKKEEVIINEKLQIIDLEERRKKLYAFHKDKFDESLIKEYQRRIVGEEKHTKSFYLKSQHMMNFCVA